MLIENVKGNPVDGLHAAYKEWDDHGDGPAACGIVRVQTDDGDVVVYGFPLVGINRVMARTIWNDAYDEAISDGFDPNSDPSTFIWEWWAPKLVSWGFHVKVSMWG